MTFPDEALDVRVELKLGDAWTDITPHVYTRDPITITRGRQDEGSRTDPSTCSMTLNNRDGRYSPRNVNGPYYGLLGRNTPVRVSVPQEDTYLRIQPDDPSSKITTPDNAGLDITGDLDVRIDIYADQWDAGDLAARYEITGDHRSWWFGVDGRLEMFWSPDGTFASRQFAQATAELPRSTGRMAVRFTLDVNNGAGGRTVTFYTADTIAGPWTQLGAPVVQAGTTSVHGGTATLEVGAVEDLTVTAAGGGAVPGRYLGFELRNGIGGTVVANPDFTAQTEGATSFADAAGRVWTVNGGASISNRNFRFTGEVPAWPVRWGPSGQDVHVQIEAAGITRRLGQGRKALPSALRRAVASAPALIKAKFGEAEIPIVAYWPMEDGAGATQAAPGIPGIAPLRAVGPVTFSNEPSGGTAGGASFGDGGKLIGTSPAVPPDFSAGNGAWLIVFWLDLPADMGTDAVSPILQWRTPGSPLGILWSLYTGQGINGLPLLEVTDAAKNIQFSGGGTTDLRGRGPVQISIEANGVSSSGFRVRVDGQSPPDISGTIIGDSISTPTAIGVNLDVAAGTDFSGTISHLIVAPNVSWQEGLATGLVSAGQGYRGETAAARFTRLCEQEAIPAAVIGDEDDSEPMGPQLPAPVLDLLGEGEDADGGILYEARDALALRYRPRAADYNTPPALVLDYHDQVAAPLEPVDDDQNTRNDVTVERVGGSSARVVIEDGPLSTQAPPDGVGIYDESLTLNVADDDQLLPIAGWKAHLGTVDEARYPVVRVKLHKHPDLIDTVTTMDVRSRIHLTGLPAWEPPGIVDLIADGYTEVLEPRRWTIEFNTVPGSPWRTGVLDDDTLGRIDTDGSVLQAAADADDTTLLVTSTGGPYWTTDPAELPFDVRVGGEVATVTAVGDGLTDSFARTVSNGWGTAPDGQAWTAIGTASRFSVASGEARLTYSATNAADIAALSQHCDAVDVELAFKSPVAAFTGAAPFLYVIGSYDQAANDWYALVMILNTDNSVGVFFERKTAGAPTALNGITIVPGVTLNNTATFRARLKIQNGLLLGRVWNGANPEPPNWHTAFFDSTHTDGGDVGVQVFLPSGVTNGLPLVFPFPELTIRNPQKLTVTRSVNGIAKAQVAGADVRLDQPSVIAL